jgi:hypothetical protein
MKNRLILLDNFNTSEELTTSRPSKFSNAYSSSGFDMLGVLVCPVHLLQNTSADSMHRSKSLSGRIRKSILALWTCHVHSSCATSRSMTYRLSIALTCLNGSQATRGPKFLDGTVGSCKPRMAKYRPGSNANTWTTARYSY